MRYLADHMKCMDCIGGSIISEYELKIILVVLRVLAHELKSLLVYGPGSPFHLFHSVLIKLLYVV